MKIFKWIIWKVVMFFVMKAVENFLKKNFWWENNNSYKKNNWRYRK